MFVYRRYLLNCTYLQSPLLLAVRYTNSIINPVSLKCLVIVITGVASLKHPYLDLKMCSRCLWSLFIIFPIKSHFTNTSSLSIVTLLDFMWTRDLYYYYFCLFGIWRRKKLQSLFNTFLFYVDEGEVFIL